MSDDPALRFWRHYAEREGALTEEDGGRTLMVLPRSMQQRFGLSETVAITADPALAREEGALLLIAGHPLLDAAAGQVLEEGDGGHLWLAWPSAPLPTAASLLGQARDGVGVDHGRIDQAGVPVPTYAPVLRVGVRATYSLHDRFHEQEEVWVDALSGLPMAPALGQQVAGLPALEGRPVHPALDPDLTRAVAGAHRRLEERTATRMAALARQVARFRDDEQALAEEYYKTALESIDQRRQGSSSDRQRLLEAQADATRQEWARRRQEIQQKFEPQMELSPVRLHLVWVPAMSVPAVVHRGQRAFPLTLIWWLPTGGFAPVGCPSCGSPAQLVAGRDRLVCRGCQPRPESVPVPPPSRLPPRGGKQPPAPTAAPPAPPPAPVLRRSSQERGGLDPEALSLEWLDEAFEVVRQQAMASAARRRRVIRIGDNLGFSFWQAVVDHDPWPRKRADPDSPLRVAYRLFGAEGPLRALGIPPGVTPDQSSSSTFDPGPGLLHCTDGLILTRAGEFPFSLHWRIVAGKPVVEEVLPVLGAVDARIPMNSVSPVAVRGLFGAAPSPHGELDPVAALLWTSELPRSGLPLVLRCLAAWGRAQRSPLPDAPPEHMAAALTAIVGRRAGLNLTRERAAAAYSVDPRQVAALARLLQPLLGLSVKQWW
ncbi:MAG: hypothetical protein ACYCYK_07680 [Candidatus Dormibacteria bacterium]